MMSTSASHLDPRKVASIAAAVGMYLDRERRESYASGINAWRRYVMPANDDVFRMRQRSWTGRD